MTQEDRHFWPASYPSEAPSPRSSLMATTPAPTSSAKAQLRAALLAQRAALSARRCSEADAAILEQLLRTSHYQAAATIFSYVSVGDEVDTRGLMRAALSAGKRVCVPRCRSLGQMDAVAISSEAELVEGSYGLLEPRAELPAVAPKNIELIIVPCLAATRDGLRIGYGGGVYDRY
ncbi:MAG: 5-formyltetrahydrofolate cyclo-ligase, partial [Coriobacteriales bacterium]|nr:5-formyltetrahydrofolate cyclo-ligase [Coriobacteriales bacterium]